MIKKFFNYILILYILFFLYINKGLSIDTHLKLLNILESNYPLEITFEQNYKDEKTLGWMVIDGKGMARTEFAPPNNNIIVADGKWIMFYNPEIERTTYIPLENGILEIMLKPKSLTKNKVFEVKEEIKNNKIIFNLIFNLNKNVQNIVIYFNKETNKLIGWKLYESDNDYIEVKVLTSKKFDFSNNQNFFRLPNLDKQSEIIYLGPYKKRKVNKFLGSGRSN